MSLLKQTQIFNHNFTNNLDTTTIFSMNIRFFKNVLIFECMQETTHSNNNAFDTTVQNGANIAHSHKNYKNPPPIDSFCALLHQWIWIGTS